MIRGFDLSYYQWSLKDSLTGGRYYVAPDYGRALAAGIEFAFLKACDGATDIPLYSVAMADARKYLPCAPYVWIWEKVNTNLQVDLWFSRLKDEKIIVIDFEDWGSDMPKGMHLKAAILRLREIGYTGKIGVYSRYDYLTYFAKNELAWLFTNIHFLWLSDPDSQPLIPPPFTKYDFWQYTWTADAPTYGITNGTTELDMNYFNGTRDELLALFGNVPTPPPNGGMMEITPVFEIGSRIRSAAMSSATQVGSLAFGSKLPVVSLVGNAGTEQWAEVTWMAKPAYINVWIGGVQNATLSGTLPPPSGAGATVEIYANGAMVHSANVAAGGKIRIDVAD